MWDIIGDLAQLSTVFQTSTLPIHQQLQLKGSVEKGITDIYVENEFIVAFACSTFVLFAHRILCMDLLAL